MNELLKGNFKPNTNVIREKKQETMEERFESAALATLGGSIGYVSRKSFVWTGDNENPPESKD